MLCVDLTEQVLAEAVSMHADVIICYSPMPHHPLTSLSPNDPQGRICLKCAMESIAVFSVHTACANAPRGVADWLAEPVTHRQLACCTSRQNGVSNNDGV